MLVEHDILEWDIEQSPDLRCIVLAIESSFAPVDLDLDHSFSLFFHQSAKTETVLVIVQPTEGHFAHIVRSGRSIRFLLLLVFIYDPFCCFELLWCYHGFNRVCVVVVYCEG